MSRPAHWDVSASSWLSLMERGDINRTEILDEPMRRLAGQVASLQVLDVGCGEGRFCRMLADAGAHVIGIDPTSKLLDAAKKRHPAGNYLEGTGEALPFATGSFDLVVCYLVLIDIPDYRRAIGEMARVARPGGRLLIANLNPFCTTPPDPNERDEVGRRKFLKVGTYSEELALEVVWAGLKIVNYHRPLSAYIRAFLQNGLTLTHFEEPVPSAEILRRLPKMREDVEIPLFHVMQWRKDAR